MSRQNAATQSAATQSAATQSAVLTERDFAPSRQKFAPLTPSVLVVEDDRNLREALCDTLVTGGRKAIGAENGEQALRFLQSEPVDMILSDINMDVMDGHTLLKRVKKIRPDLPVVMITAHGGVEGAVEAIKSGASDYLQKPFDAEVLIELIERFTPEKDDKHKFGVVAEDRQTKMTYALALKVASSVATVLITGESGTGKEVMARFIHQSSERRDKPFIAVNCAAIPENMLESMLFGYEKGAYTGAHQSRPGKFELANGGTLLLDEISEMDLALQAKLLRVLQEREVERLGGNKLIPLDVRVLATTNRNMRREVTEGRFREDLYYRLNVFPLHNPALRQRPGDILPLAERFLKHYAAGKALSFSQQACDKLNAYSWPGNVRELENAVQRSIIITAGSVIEAGDIQFESELETESYGPEQKAPGLDAENSKTGDGMLQGSLKAKENQTILDALVAVGGCRKKTAEKLGISPRTLRYKIARLKEQGVQVPAVGRQTTAI